MKITYLRKLDATPRTIPFPDFPEYLKSDKQQQMIRAFRQNLHYCGENCTPSEKEKMPAIVFSSLYRKREEIWEWDSYTGLVLVEIDGLTGPAEAAIIRRKASDCLSTLSAFTGSSGQSVKIIVAFTCPDGSLPRTREEAECFHVHAYRRAVEFYRFQLHRNISRKEPSIDRGCLLSYDPEMYYNPAAIPITMEQPVGIPEYQEIPAAKELSADLWERVLPDWKKEERSSYLFDIALRELLRRPDAEELHRDPETFLIRLAEQCFRTGIPEEEAVKRIRLYSSLGENEDRVRVVIHNVYLMGKGFGGNPAVPPVQLLVLQMEEFMARRYDLRHNLLKKRVEYRERAALFARFRGITDEALNTISLQAHREGLNFWDRDVKRYIHSHHIPFYNPIEDYLDSLPAWNGQDHIRRLADTLPTDNPHWHLCFYRWFLGVVAQWKGINRKHGNCVVPLLSGEQSTGKSTWCKNLLPPELREYYTESLDLTARYNAEQALNRFALINLDEFDSIAENKQPLLKHLLQLPEVAVRRLYSSHIEHLPRYASFIATCNPMDILTDPTGSRRFIIRRKPKWPSPPRGIFPLWRWRTRTGTIPGSKIPAR